MATYKPLQTGATPTLGTSGEAVKALQTQLNTANQGVSGYTPLKVDGLYGPLTQAASQFKAPTTTPTPTPDTSGMRFERGTNKNDALISDITKKIQDNTVTPRSEDEIFSTMKGQAQGIIDSITSEFNRQIEAQNVTNAGLNDRVRALNVGAGLGGSDFGTAAAVKQEQKNQGAIDLINKEKQAKIYEVLNNLGSRATEQARKEKQDYIKSLGDNLDLIRKVKDEDKARATETIQNLARQNITLDKFKQSAPEEFKQTLDEYGGSEMDLEGVWNESLPTGLKANYENKIIQGPNGMASVLRYWVDPQTGQMTQKEYPLNVNYNTLQGVKPTIVDGRLWAIETDANGNLKGEPLTQKTVTTKVDNFKLTGTQKSKLLGTNLKNSEINDIESDINKYGLEEVLSNQYLTEPQKTAIKAIFATTKSSSTSSDEVEP